MKTIIISRLIMFESGRVVGAVYNIDDCIDTINKLSYKGDMILVEIWEDNKSIAEGQLEISNNADITKEHLLTCLKRTVYVG
ncbi:hypothetical protein RGZ1_261 [Morganella phage vB_MmoM_Rgz1]|nr:hypothetical protein RGZ1_261 [Morganella phage vB_MmoM_Rgz1]